MPVVGNREDPESVALTDVDPCRARSAVGRSVENVEEDHPDRGRITPDGCFPDVDCDLKRTTTDRLDDPCDAVVEFDDDWFRAVSARIDLGCRRGVLDRPDDLGRIVGDDPDEFLCLGNVRNPSVFEVSGESVDGGERCSQFVGEAREEPVVPLPGVALVLDLRLEDADPAADSATFNDTGDDPDRWSEQPEHDDGGDADRARCRESERDDDTASNSGSAYVYRFDGTEWVEEQKAAAAE